MRDRIIELITGKPRHYTRFIKKSPELLAWVQTNSRVVSDNISEMIYSALNNTDNICTYGNKKKFISINEGYSGCGTAAKCKCTCDNIRESVIKTKSQYTVEKRQEINHKREHTMISRYGAAYNSQREDIHHIWSKPKIPADVFAKLNNIDWLDTEYNKQSRTAVDIAQDLGVYYSTVIEYCLKHGFTIRKRSSYSIIEKEICQWLSDNGIDYEHVNWHAIGRELDIYIPSKKLAIEVNGLYWHSWHPSSKKPEDSKRHITKTTLATVKNIDLFHVTDFEWTNKQDIIKAMLSSKLGLNESIYARNCTVQNVSKTIEREFLNKYHLQGYIPSKFCVGLFQEGKLMSVMSVGNSRFSKLSPYELLRYCTISGTTVVGGGSRLLKAITNNYSSLVTYCDLSKSSGSGYLAMGFKPVKDTDPGYFWTDGNVVISRFKAQKSQLAKWLPSYNSDLSESENMFNSKYRRFYDCGNRVFVYP